MFFSHTNIYFVHYLKLIGALRKQTLWHSWPAYIQTNMCIRADWSWSLLFACKTHNISETNFGQTLWHSWPAYNQTNMCIWAAWSRLLLFAWMSQNISDKHFGQSLFIWISCAGGWFSSFVRSTRKQHCGLWVNQPKHAAQANPDRHLSPPLGFLFQESLIYTSIPLRRNMTADLGRYITQSQKCWFSRVMALL